MPEFDMQAFCSAFMLYKGISQFYNDVALDPANKSNSDCRKDEKTGYLAKDERLVRAIRCDPSWPVCIFDFTTSKTLREFFVFRVRAPL